MRLLLSFFIAVGVSCFATAAIGAEPTKPVRFGLEVLPILSDNCFFCHGPDEKHREADLRLDVRESAVEHEAIVPGKSDASELLRRLTSTDPDVQMPPPSSNRKVSPEQIALLKRWIDEGAVWGTHWAYESPKRPPLPKATRQAWTKNPIDAFILARLEEEKLTPSPEADAATLCRRLYLDLTGVPPTADEVKDFVSHFSPSPALPLSHSSSKEGEIGEGESGRNTTRPSSTACWLRRATASAGLGTGSMRRGTPTRADTRAIRNGRCGRGADWVVRAINDNMPYDQFTVEQLAGDLLPNATLDQKMATGFNRNHMFNAEGGRISEETRVENVMDRTESTGTVWLGLTVGCARCHDHKFDPLTNREYFQLYAYFNNTSESGTGRRGANEPNIEISNETDRAAAADAAKKLKGIADDVKKLEDELFPRGAKEPASKSPAAAELSGNLITALDREPGAREADALGEMVNHFKATNRDYTKQLSQLKAAVEERDRALGGGLTQGQ